MSMMGLLGDLTDKRSKEGYCEQRKSQANSPEGAGTVRE